ncbi:hypothetical protein SAMN05421771_1678 [Granulicella pectinivorans]|jgi:hypothetical protein|uniref:Uncharacterized protein n=2 Tax=Granulicella pectinivorans TaxID=474950 RepID=A0A1I6M1Y0_9BACT|nr:hypothetical protein SAMN05421771_1678 [Granulicella pectinivorans]
MPFMPTKEAKIRYRTRAIPLLVVMIGLHFGVHWVFDTKHPTGALGVGLALLPPLSLVVLGGLIVQFLNADRDEVQMAYRRHAVAWATGGLLAVALVWNGLGVYGFASEVAPGMALPVFVGFLLVAGIALKRQYQ